MPRASERRTTWWLEKLEQRARSVLEREPAFDAPTVWENESERLAAIAFFNAAFRAEEAGLSQAEELAKEVAATDPELARTLRLYGAEEGWHRELLEKYLAAIGGSVTPMGRVTRTFQRLHARARRMESIVLTNLMFEAIGSTTYRLALGRVPHPSAQGMLRILTRDEAFHVPLNVHFLREVLATRPESSRLRLRALSNLLYVSLVLLPLASRPKARAFDRIGTRELSRAYAVALARLFREEADLGLGPPRWVLALLGLSNRELSTTDDLLSGSADAADRAAAREGVEVVALP